MNGIHKMTIAGLVLGGCAAFSAEAVPDRAEVFRLAASVVKVQAFDENGRTFFGTGVVVAPGRIATSCHVTRRSAQIVVVYRGGTFEVSGQQVDIDHDMCVLDVPGLAAPQLPTTRSAQLRVGQAVWAMGFEGGAGLQFRTGFVRALHKHDGAWVIESTTAFTSGSSGGALMDDDGHLIGLLTYRLRGDRRSYFSVPMDWMPAATVAPPPVAPMLNGAAFWQREAGGLPYFLRAHRMVIDSEWRALSNLSDDWLQDDTSNAEAWWYKGASLEMLSSTADAVQAYRQALLVDPGFVPALFSLGRLSAQMGDNGESERMVAALSAIHTELGTCLSIRIRPPRPTEEIVLEACSVM